MTELIETERLYVEELQSIMEVQFPPFYIFPAASA